MAQEIAKHAKQASSTSSTLSNHNILSQAISTLHDNRTLQMAVRHGFLL